MSSGRVSINIFLVHLTSGYIPPFVMESLLGPVGGYPLISITLEYIPPFVMESRLHGKPARPIGPVSVNIHFRLHTPIRYEEPARSSGRRVSINVLLIRINKGTYHHLLWRAGYMESLLGSVGCFLLTFTSGYIPPFVIESLLGPVGGYLLTAMVMMAAMSTGSGEVMGISSIIIYDIYKTYVNPYR